jgi:hypothetical protein
LLDKPQQEREQITAEHDILEHRPQRHLEGDELPASPIIMPCPDTSPDREDNDAGQHSTHGGEHPVCSGG